VNVVGYYNIVTPANGYTFLANQLTNSGNNPNVILTNGPHSDVNGVQNTVLYFWNGTGYNAFQYFSGPDADNYFLIGPGSPAGWYDPSGSPANVQLRQGAGNFIYNPFGTAITNTLVGQVAQGAYSVAVATGFNALSLVPPVATNFDGAFANFPGKSDVNGVNNDVYFFWNGTGYNSLQYFTGPDADNYFLIGPGSPNGWYDPSGNLQSLNPALQPKVGAAFFVQRFGAGSNWVYSFTVQ
jgi:hypothetical protein